MATRRPCTEEDHDEIQAILAEIEGLDYGAKLDKSPEELEQIAVLIDRKLNSGHTSRQTCCVLGEHIVAESSARAASH